MRAFILAEADAHRLRYPGDTELSAGKMILITPLARTPSGLTFLSLRMSDKESEVASVSVRLFGDLRTAAY